MPHYPNKQKSSSRFGLLSSKLLLPQIETKGNLGLRFRLRMPRPDAVPTSCLIFAAQLKLSR